MTIACVLRSGGWCGPVEVERLAAGFRRHLQLPFHFVCLTDVALELAGVTRIPIPQDAPAGWWAKMLLFQPDLFTGRVFYADLDTVLVGDVGELVSYAGPFGMISDFYRPDQAQTGLMAWDADGKWPAELWDAWEHGASFGSQGRLVAAVLHGREDRLDRMFPGQIASYKVHCRRAQVLPADARIVCLHGLPRPAEVPAHDPVALAWRGQ